MIPYLWLEEAQERLAGYIKTTALTYDPEKDLYIKWENQQVTGSFKARGALNKVLCLQDWERQRGLVTASAGNHGQGVALAGKLTGAPVIVFASQQAVPTKLQAMRELGAELRLVPGGYGDAELAALEFMRSGAATWISPYNDGQVIAGQGTIGLEVLRDATYQLDNEKAVTWIVPVSGGGLISGVGASVKSREARLSGIRLVGAQSEASAFMHDLYYQGSQESTVELPSLADGLAGPVEPGSLTIPIVRQFVDQIVLVTEAQIAQAIRYCWEKYGERIEGSGAVGLAAALYDKVVDRPAVIIISGGNIQPETHRAILEGSL